MATEKKTTTTTTTTANAKAEPNYEVLLKQIADLQAQLNQLSAKAPEAEVVELDTQERMIPFISLVSGSVMLKGTPKRPYEIEGKYQTRYFTETEARVIASQMGNFLQEGYVYINDPQFIRSVGLTEAYKNLLKPDDLKTLFNKTPEAVLNLYQAASEGQRQIIWNMVCSEYDKNPNFDANIIRGIEKLSGKNIVNVVNDEEK